MKYLFVILLFISIGAYAQKPDIIGVEEAVGKLDQALLKRDSVALKTLLSNELSYGHSNGWIESKWEVMDDLYNGKLIYKKIDRQLQNSHIDGNIASIRMNTDVEVELNGKPMTLKLSVLQVWIWRNKHWELFARQSVKM